VVERCAAFDVGRFARLESGHRREVGLLGAGAVPEVRQQAPCDGRRQRRLPAHDLLQLLDQHLEAVFLQQVAVGPALQRRKQVVIVGVQRRHDLGGGIARQLRQQLHAVAVGQLEVDHEQLERVGRGAGMRIAGSADMAARRFEVARFGDQDRVAEAFAHDAAQESARHGVVFDDQDFD
jgi:hypothetical protein